jgi:ribosome-binding protein aMBF1 (putative translation factor)
MAIDELVRARVAQSCSQYDLARKWKRNQSVIAKIETCERRIDLIEFIDLCVILKIDPIQTISLIHEKMKAERSEES